MPCTLLDASYYLRGGIVAELFLRNRFWRLADGEPAPEVIVD